MSFKEKVTLKDVAMYSVDKIHIDNINKDNYISTENLLSNYGGKIVSSGLPNVKTVSEYKVSDVLISNIRPYFKKIWRAKFEGGASNDVLVIRAKENIIPEFLYYNLANDYFFDYVMSGTKGTKMPRGDKKHIMDFEINLPPIPEQKAIAHILSTLDEKIEVNNKINKTLENMAQSIFKEWFVDFEFPNEDGEPYKSSGGEMIESELGMIPKGWEVKILGEYFKFIKGKKPKNIEEKYYDNYSKYLTIDVLNRNSILYCSIDRIVKVKKTDILMVMDGASSGQIYYGQDGVVASTLSKIEILDKDIGTDFIYSALKSYESEIKRHTTGSAIPHTDKDYVSKIRIALAKEGHLMEEFEKNIRLIRMMIINRNEENQKLKAIRDSLLPKLMSGEIRVPF